MEGTHTNPANRPPKSIGPLHSVTTIVATLTSQDVMNLWPDMSRGEARHLLGRYQIQIRTHMLTAGYLALRKCSAN